MKKFSVGDEVTYRYTTGIIDYIDEDYLSLCFLDEAAPETKTGRHRTCLLVYRNYWDELHPVFGDT